jgi:hypothetical protein
VPDIDTFGGPPQEWRDGLHKARVNLLSVFVQNSQTALRLKDYWESSCAQIRLLDLPRKHRDPKEILGFFAQQGHQLEVSIRELTEAWNQSVTRIVTEEPMYLTKEGNASRASSQKAATGGGALPGSTPAETESRFFESIAMLLSQMAREVVEQTLNEYVAFFERFSAEPLTYPEVKNLTDHQTWQDEFLLNRLQIGPKDDSIIFKNTMTSSPRSCCILTRNAQSAFVSFSVQMFACERW